VIKFQLNHQTTTTILRPFFRTTRVSRCQNRTSGFMVQGKTNRGRHTDHPAGRHSIRTNQCSPPPSPHFLQAGCPSCRPPNFQLKCPKINCYLLKRKWGGWWRWALASPDGVVPSRMVGVSAS